MEDDENSDDRQTLICAESLQGVIREDEVSINSLRSRRNSGHHPPNIFHELPPVRQMTFFCILLIICTTGLVICLPPYIKVIRYFFYFILFLNL